MVEMTARTLCAVLVGVVVYSARVPPVGLVTPPPSGALAQGSRADDELAEAQRLNEEGTAIRSAGKFSQAVPLVQRALAIREKILGSEHPDVAASLDNLAGLYRDQGKYAEAEVRYRRALAIGEKALGPEHPRVAASLNNLAGLYHAQGKYGQAEPGYRRALSILEKALGPKHPDVATVLESLAVVLRKTKRTAEAKELEARARVINAQHAQTKMKGNSD